MLILTSSGLMTTSTGMFSPNPESTHSKSWPMKLTSLSRSIVPQKMLLSPMKSATKEFTGSL